MPTQPPISPFVFKGPFLGLNTTDSERDLSPAYAAEATNILLDEGAIMVRPPFKKFIPTVAPWDRPDADPLPSSTVSTLFEWWPPRDPGSDSDDQPRHILRQYGGRLIVGENRELSNKLSVRPAQYIHTNGRLYVVGSTHPTQTSAVVIKDLDARLVGLVAPGIFNKRSQAATGVPIDGEIVYRMVVRDWTGITVDERGGTLPSPSLEIAPYEIAKTENTPIGNWRGAEYSWAVSLYNSEDDVESNALVANKTLDLSAFVNIATGAFQNIDPTRQSITIQIAASTTLYSGDRPFDKLRVYQSRVDINEPYYLVAEIDRAAAIQLGASTDNAIPHSRYNDDDSDNIFWEAASRRGNTVIGPFRPVKNAPPPRIRVAAMYKDRLFYSREDHPERLYYTQIGSPEHSDDGDYELLDDDGGWITGIAELSGQLVILKEKSIWILSGVIVTTTNATIATGASPPASPHQLYRTKSPVGCSNTLGGNGAIVAGHPPVLYFNAASGFYAFDGVDTRLLSEKIRPTWETFTGNKRALRQGVTYAVDTRRQILFITNLVDTSGRSVPHVHAWPTLAYHYGPRNIGPDGVGAWTVITSDSGDEVISCCASLIAPGEREFGFDDVKGRYAGVMFGLANRGGKEIGTVVGVMGGSVVRMADDEASDTVFGTNVSARPLPLARYRTGRLTIMDGLTPHIYLIKYFHEQADPGPVGEDNNAPAHPRKLWAVVYVPKKPDGYRRVTDRHGRASAVLDPSRQQYLLNLTGGVVSRRAVRRSAPWVQLEFHTENMSDSVKWHRTIRIVGWELDIELAGQR